MGVPGTCIVDFLMDYQFNSSLLFFYLNAGVVYLFKLILSPSFKPFFCTNDILVRVFSKQR